MKRAKRKPRTITGNQYVVAILAWAIASMFVMFGISRIDVEMICPFVGADLIALVLFSVYVRRFCDFRP